MLFPMVDYIGVVGCIINAHLVDVYVRFYHFCFPASVAFLRYLYVVKSSWINSIGARVVSNFILLTSFLLPLFMTLAGMCFSTGRTNKSRFYLLGPSVEKRQLLLKVLHAVVFSILCLWKCSMWVGFQPLYRHSS